MTHPAVVFVSDAHFALQVDGAERRRRTSFLRFLESLQGVERLVVAGDLFQFWFDLGTTMPKVYFDILQGLRRLRLSGTHIDYLAGNHDFWRSRFFRDELEIETHADALELHTQGRHVLVLHGDGVGPGDRGYKLLKRFLRHPWTIGAAKLLHPDLLHQVAHGMDRMSHRHTSRRGLDRARLESAAEEIFTRGFDALVLGHVHTQLHQSFDRGELLVIGDWLELFSYATLEAGVFTPHRWTSPIDVTTRP